MTILTYSFNHLISEQIIFYYCDTNEILRFTVPKEVNWSNLMKRAMKTRVLGYSEVRNFLKEQWYLKSAIRDVMTVYCLKLIHHFYSIISHHLLCSYLIIICILFSFISYISYYLLSLLYLLFSL